MKSGGRLRKVPVARLIDLLISIPGPAFLFGFPLVASILVFLGWLRIRNDGSIPGTQPAYPSLNAAELAMVNGGRKLVGLTLLYSLWKRELVDLQGAGKKTTAVASKIGEVFATPMEKVMLETLRTPVVVNKLLTDRRLRTMLAPHLENMELRLRGLRFIKTRAETQMAWFTTIVVTVLLLLLGGAKLTLGVSSGKPSGLLLLLLAASLIVASYTLRPWLVATTLGQQLLSWKRVNSISTSAVSKESPASPSLEVALPVALYGTAALACIGIDARFRQAILGQAVTSGSDGRQSGGAGGGYGGGGGCGGCGR